MGKEYRSHAIGSSKENRQVWASIDSIDGTVKVAGLGNGSGIIRAANDGSWASALAFTSPTEKGLQDLVIGDFTAASITDGNPARYATYPSDIIAVGEGDALRSYAVEETLRPICTSTCGDLRQTMVYFDAFQAFDRGSNSRMDEELAVKLYAKLINRNEGGAFDVLRQYGNLSSLGRNMFGWRGYEPQCAAFVALNENLPNMLPAVPLIIGAGGTAIDFDGKQLRDRKLTDGRTSIIYAANPSIERSLMGLL